MIKYKDIDINGNNKIKLKIFEPEKKVNNKEFLFYAMAFAVLRKVIL